MHLNYFAIVKTSYISIRKTLCFTCYLVPALEILKSVKINYNPCLFLLSIKWHKFYLASLSEIEIKPERNQSNYDDYKSNFHQRSNDYSARNNTKVHERLQQSSQVADNRENKLQNYGNKNRQQRGNKQPDYESEQNYFNSYPVVGQSDNVEMQRGNRAMITEKKFVEQQTGNRRFNSGKDYEKGDRSKSALETHSHMQEYANDRKTTNFSGNFNEQHERNSVRHSRDEPSHSNYQVRNPCDEPMLAQGYHNKGRQEINGQRQTAADGNKKTGDSVANLESGMGSMTFYQSKAGRTPQVYVIL